MLNGSNFKSWKENLEIVLRVVDLDLALREDYLTLLINKSTSDDKREKERWEKLNCMCMMIMKRVIPGAFKDTMFEKIITAKEFLANIEKRFVKNEKAKMCILLTNLISMRYKGKDNIMDYILEMPHLASRLKTLKLTISDELLEEERLKQEKAESAHLTSHLKDKGSCRNGTSKETAKEIE